MKLHASLFASAVAVTMLALGGCATNPHSSASVEPALKVTTSAHNIESGTSARVTAHTANLVGAGNVHWSVSPNVARVDPDTTHGQSAIFHADQAGTYIVKAAVDVGNGQWVYDSVDITVHGVTDANGRPVSTNNSNYDRNGNYIGPANEATNR
jgi:PBP1b-binding outer membrane lipoprotein LpoB